MNTYLLFILVVLIGFSLLDAILGWLNVRAMSPEIPDEFAEEYDSEKYAKSQKYLKDHTNFDLVSGLLKTGILVAFLLLGGFAWLNNIACGVAESEIVRGLVFGGLLMLLSTLQSIPFSIYDTFVIEERYGFNKTTPGTFVADLIKGMLLTAILGGGIFALLIWFFETAGPNAWWISWVVVIAIQLLLMYIAPVWIMPLFNKFDPLEEGELRTSIEDYAQAQGFEVQGLFKIDGSRRSTKANAYFTGFGKTRRIALYDTLIDNHSIAELVAVLAHEVGHAKLKHIHKQLILGIFTTGFMFWFLSVFIGKPGMYQAFGIDNATPVYAGLVFFGFLYSPLSTIISVVQNIFSRKYEFEADAFATTTTGDGDSMITALKRLTVENLGNLTPHPALVFLEYSHPPVLQRIDAIRKVPSAN